MPTPPAFNYRPHGYSGEKALNEILDLLTFLYYSIVGGGLPVNTDGALLMKQDFVAASEAAVDCSTDSQTFIIGDADKQNYFKLVSLMFDGATPRNVTISVVIGGEARTWITFPNYTGAHIMVTDQVEGRGLQLQIDVSQHAGTFTYSVAGETL